MDRAPFGWVRCRCGFESSPFKSSTRRLSVGVYVPASRIDRENAKVNIATFWYGEVLGAKAAAVTQGTPAGRWRLEMAPPKPDSAQLQHPRQLLMADLETHLMHYALDPNCTLILMGDMNIDLCTRG